MTTQTNQPTFPWITIAANTFNVSKPARIITCVILEVILTKIVGITSKLVRWNENKLQVSRSAFKSLTWTERDDLCAFVKKLFSGFQK